MMGIPDRLQDAVIRLSESSSIDGLIATFKLSIASALTDISSVDVFILPLDQNVFAYDAEKLSLTCDAISQRQRLTGTTTVSSNDLENSTDSMDFGSGIISHSISTRVVCSPVVDLQNGDVIALTVLVCSDFSDDDHSFLTFLEKQFVSCYRRLRGHKTQTEPILTTESVLRLCSSLHDIDASSLQLKVLKFLQEQTNSEGGFLLLVDYECQQLLCQVTCNAILEKEITVPINQSGFSNLLHNKLPVSLNDISQGHLDEIMCLLDCTVTSSTCFPVVCQVTGEVMAIVCLINKSHASLDSFTERDKSIVNECFTYTATVLYSAIAVQHERRLKKHTESLLSCARNLFSHLEVLPELLKEIMQEAKTLTGAERCSVFLVESKTNDLIAEVFDCEIKETSSQKLRKPKKREVRVPMTSGIAGHVAMSGEMLNIEDAYSHSLFYNGVDELTGFQTRNILCFPLKDPAGKVVGVAQLCNKIGGGIFTKFDEMIATGFAVLCSISVMHSMLYKKVKDAQARVQLSNELMIYHMQVVNDEVQSLVSTPLPSPKSFLSDMDQFTSIPRNIPTEDTPLAVISMMEDLGFIEHFRIPRDCLSRFVMMAKRGYRDPPYHNWLHAFAVVHFCYLLLKNVEWRSFIDDIEALALFVACLCHDIDHRGTNNAYQKASGSLLHTLYSSEGSMLERHHFAQTMCILNTDGCNIFENVSREDYIRVLDLMQDIILATDLTQHMAIIQNLQKMADDGYQRADKQHRKLLIRLMMTACDLSDQTKNFQNSQTVAELIYAEFFTQGDLEKDIGQQPMEFMDRERAIIPNLQINFIDSIALPVYGILASVMPETREVLHVVENNREMWSAANEKLIKFDLPRNMAMFRHLPTIMSL